MSDFQAKRTIKDSTHRISASAADIFPLLCPVREYDWIDGWNCRMIYSDTGVAENNGIFTTAFPRGVEEVWVVSRYEPERYTIQFVAVNPESHVMKLDIKVEERGENAADVRFTNTFTGLTEKGNAFLQQYAAETYDAAMSRLFLALENYCTTGRKLKAESHHGLGR
jgi:hypothetical protein